MEESVSGKCEVFKKDGKGAEGRGEARRGEEGRGEEEACGEPGRDVSHQERDMTPCQANKCVKSPCQERQERDRFWPCVSVFAPLECAFVCRVYLCVCDRDG